MNSRSSLLSKNSNRNDKVSNNYDPYINSGTPQERNEIAKDFSIKKKFIVNNSNSRIKGQKSSRSVQCSPQLQNRKHLNTPSPFI
jgi:hypothetical protein